MPATLKSLLLLLLHVTVRLAAIIMESLLSVSFDNISSKDVAKIRKGLRQIEGLLAQICLNNVSASAQQPQSPIKGGNKRQSAMLLDAAPKTLQALSDDLAFRDFFRLQESFEWNGARP